MKKGSPQFTQNQGGAGASPPAGDADQEEKNLDEVAAHGRLFSDSPAGFKVYSCLLVSMNVPLVSVSVDLRSAGVDLRSIRVYSCRFKVY